MTPNVADLKGAVSFRELVSEDREISADGKALCPFHEDHHPSFHVYADHGFCYACGAHADQIDWLVAVHDRTTAEAIEELRQRAGGYIAPVRRAPEPVKRSVKAPKSCAARPVEADALASYMQRAARLDQLPLAAQGRGFSLEDARRLHLARDRDDLLFAIPGPDGVVLALKRRYGRPRGDQRYTYELPGHGAPAWCSPKFSGHDTVLVVEGELNGMACHLARPDLAVMAAAGSEGRLHLEALRGKTVFVYADGDEPGDRARQRWARAAHGAGAAKAYALESWEADACDIAGMLGRGELAERLKAGLESAHLTQKDDLPQRGIALNKPRLEQTKPHLTQHRNDSKGLPCLGGKPCL